MLLSTVIAFSKNTTVQTYCLFVWLFQVLSGVAYVHWRKLQKNGRFFLFSYSKREKFELLFLLLASSLISFLFLTTYPFHTIGDGLRDLGLLYQKQENNSLNLFEYGYAGNPSLVVIALLSPFYKIFGNTALSMRFPGALFSVLDVLVFYFALRKAGLRNFAFVGALLLACDRFHLYFARTEQLVFMSSLFASLALYGFAQLAHKLTFSRVAFLALWMGFSTAFMASAIVVYVFSVLFLIIFICSETLLKKRSVKLFFAYSAVALSCFVVGVGPRIAVSQTHFISDQIKKKNDTKSATLLNSVQIYADRYVKSWDGVFYKTRSTYKHFRDSTPFLDKFGLFFFIAGLIYCCVKMRERSFLRVLLAFLFLILFFNSALTNGIDNDNRIFTIVPFLIFIMMFGVHALRHIVIFHRTQVMVAANVLMLLYAGFCGVQFFAEQRASLSMFGALHFASGQPGDSDAYLPFLFGNIMRTIQSEEFSHQAQICVTANAKILKYLGLRHNEENFNFYGKKKEIRFVKNPALDDFTVHMSNGCLAKASSQKVLTFCEQKRFFTCPENSGVNDKKPFRIILIGI